MDRFVRPPDARAGDDQGGRTSPSTPATQPRPLPIKQALAEVEAYLREVVTQAISVLRNAVDVSSCSTCTMSRRAVLTDCVDDWIDEESFQPACGLDRLIDGGHTGSHQRTHSATRSRSAGTQHPRRCLPRWWRSAYVAQAREHRQVLYAFASRGARSLRLPFSRWRYRQFGAREGTLMGLRRA